MARAISKSVAAVVEQLELEGDLLVTTARLADVLRSVGGQPDDASRMAYELQRAGWLGQLRTRQAWEFIPGARGGVYGSGDRFIEFRAQLAVHPSWPGVLAMESAASVLGFAQRIPEREVVAIPPGDKIPKALNADWRNVGLQLPMTHITTVNELPTWNTEGLIFGIAVRPAGYRDIQGLGQWLPDAAGRVDIDRVGELLAIARPAARQRFAYILGAGGNSDARSELVCRYPPEDVAWLGPRAAGTGFFDSETKVNDTLLYRYLGIGTGS
jgi:AbiEi antitoxin C-terminal domain